MDKNTLIGLGLIVLIVIGYGIYTAPSKAERERELHVADSIANVLAEQVAVEAKKEAEAKAVEDTRTAEAVSVPDSLVGDSTLNIDSLRTAQEVKERLDRFGIFHGATAGTPENIVLENDDLELRVSTNGARPVWIRLKQYKGQHEKPLLLQDPDSGRFAYEFRYNGNRVISTQDLYFTAERKDARTVSFVANSSIPGKRIVIDYALDSAGWFVRSNARFENLKEEVEARGITLKWDLVSLSLEKHKPHEEAKSSVFYKYVNADREYLSETKDDSKKLEGRTNWIAFKQHFFSAVVVSDEGFASSGCSIGVRALPNDSGHIKAFSATLAFEKQASDEVNIPLRFYFGPNHYNTLRRTEVPELDRIIDLGWGIFGWMNRWVVIPIFNFFSKFNLNYGIIILLLTIAIKLLLMPLTYRNQKSGARMRALKPEIAAITEKHKDGDALKKQQATMELYRKAGVNPASGCVPMLIQMPVLYAMFMFFPSSIELRQQGFLWADDLSTYDSIATLPFTVPLNYGSHVSLFTILMAISTIGFSLLNSKQMPQQQGMPSMKLMIWLFPIMMLFFMNSLPAGLSLYYLLANIISILQMTVFSRWFIDEDKLRAELLENMKKPKKKSRWQQRLEDMQKQQQVARKK
ncbi:MAG: membrane protein insertase YidC [Flavobacteriales bacterium]